MRFCGTPPREGIARLIGGGGGGGDSNNPAKDYEAVGLMAGEFFWTLRLSLGDPAACEAA